MVPPGSIQFPICGRSIAPNLTHVELELGVFIPFDRSYGRRPVNFDARRTTVTEDLGFSASGPVDGRFPLPIIGDEASNLLEVGILIVAGSYHNDPEHDGQRGFRCCQLVTAAAAAGVTGVKAAAATRFSSGFLSMGAVAASVVGTGLNLTRSNVQHRHFSGELFIVNTTLRVFPSPHYQTPVESRNRIMIPVISSYLDSSDALENPRPFSYLHLWRSPPPQILTVRGILSVG